MDLVDNLGVGIKFWCYSTVPTTTIVTRSILEYAHSCHFLWYREITGISGIPRIPSILGIPGIPEIPDISGIPGIPGIPGTTLSGGSCRFQKTKKIFSKNLKLKSIKNTSAFVF